jgi:hypothetical protein
MKSALSHTWPVCLVASVLPLTAQAQMRTGSFDLRGPATLVTAGPLASAVTLEAVRRTTAGESITSVVEPAQHSEGFKPLQGRLKPGDTIFVTDRQGREVTAKLTRLSSASLVIVVNGDEREVLFTDIGWIEKRGGIGPGTLISTGVVAWLGMASTQDLRGGSLGAIAFAIGALRDRARHRTLVYGAQPDSLHAFRPRSPVSSFGELWARVKSGDTIYVLDADGGKTTGTFEQVSASSIALLVDGQSREIPESDVGRIVRRVSGGGVRVLTGALIGTALLGIGPAVASVDAKNAHPVIGAFVGAGIGAGIGSLIPRRTVVYSTTSSTKVAVAPLVSGGRKGLAVSFTF